MDQQKYNMFKGITFFRNNCIPEFLYGIVILVSFLRNFVIDTSFI